jgi:hypothetical protein
MTRLQAPRCIDGRLVLYHDEMIFLSNVYIAVQTPSSRNMREHEEQGMIVLVILTSFFHEHDG